MNLSNQTRTILMVVVVLLLAYFLFNQFQPVQNEGVVENLAETQEVEVAEEQEVAEETMEETMEENDENPVEDYLSNKMNSGRNQAAEGEYKKISYLEGSRGQLSGPAEWERHFDNNNDIIGAGMGGNMDEFAPNDDGAGTHASFSHDKSTKRIADQDQDVNDVFDSKNYMPGEVNNNWYEVMPEPVSVKNHHLISVTRPLGVNTIGSSNRNMSFDLRGDEACPRFNVGPFLNSSIEPSPYPTKLQMA